VSHLPAGTPLRLTGQNVWIEGTQGRGLDWDYVMYMVDPRRPTVPESGKLTVTYQLSRSYASGIRISDFINQSFTAAVDGDTIHLDFSFDKGVRFVYMPYFDLFKQFRSTTHRDPMFPGQGQWPGHFVIYG
jgi:hypothetical protein